jgi:hypothetical protein
LGHHYPVGLGLEPVEAGDFPGSFSFAPAAVCIKEKGRRDLCRRPFLATAGHRTGSAALRNSDCSDFVKNILTMSLRARATLRGNNVG